MSDEPVTFLASLPPIMSAIRIGQDGARLQLDIPASEAAAIGFLGSLHGKVLSVAIVVMDQVQKCTEVNNDTVEEKPERSTLSLGRRRS